jgi:transcriptional regulator with XRE-family HTH domain
MNSDNANDNMNSIPSVSLFRGIYNRVAKRLGVDPSYVSRVARGERKSAVVEKALAEEVRVIREHLNDHENNNNHNHNHNENHGSPNQTLDLQRKKSKVSPRKDSTLEV